MKRFQSIALLVCLFFCANAKAQLQVEISGVGANQIPVAIATFTDDSITPHAVSEIIKADLMRSGMFKVIGTDSAIPENAPVNYSEWRNRGADAIAIGSVQRGENGRFDIRYRLFDTVKMAQLSALAFTFAPDSTRLSAHKIADDIYEKLIGVRGVFATRIAYVTKAARNEYRLEVADADGEGTQIALRSNEPIISPVWSPDGTKVAYVSFENKKPVVYVQNLVTRVRTIIANHKGSNSAPAWSPDGNRVALALSRDGLTQVYIADADGGSVRRITNSRDIDTEPQFSADGQSIFFTSDRSGGPQIYKVSVQGGEPKRITFNGSYNISPRVSPDGKVLAYISRREGQYQLYALDLATGEERRLSESSGDESPSFAPNGQYIMYATESGRRGTLAVVSIDGRVKHRLTTRAGDVREPTWGPFMK